MDAREDAVIKEDPAAEATTSSNGELAAGRQPAGQTAGVNFGVSTGGVQPIAGGVAGNDDSSPDIRGVRSSGAGLGGAGHRPRARARRVRAGGGHDHAVGAPEPVGDGRELGSPSQPERPLPDIEEHIVVADPRGPEQDGPGVVVVRVDVDLQLGAAMRSAALLAMFVAAMALVGEADASRRGQFRALTFWLGGCIGLFRWFLRRRQ